MKKSRTTTSCLGHLLTLLALLIFIIGCVVLGYIAWILSTSVSIQKLRTGSLILTYVIIGIGFPLFFTGLVAFVAGAIETACIIRLYIVMVAVNITSAIGGILALQIGRIQIGDILWFAWHEANQSTKNMIQSSLHCCGFTGPKEFAGNNHFIDDSCYEVFQGEKRLKQTSCVSQMNRWLDSNKVIWIPSVSAVFIIQILSVLVASLGLHFLARRRRHRRNESRSSSNRHLYDDSDTSDACRDSL